MIKFNFDATNASLKIVSIIILCCFCFVTAFSQNVVTGIVYETDRNEDLIPLEFVSVYWANTNIGTITKTDGTFALASSKKSNLLVFSYVGFLADTVDMSSKNYYEKIMLEDVTLDEVTIKEKRLSTEISFINPLQVISINEEELCKAACCSLSESFETNPVIDVSFTDAITGTHQIKMLGLAGKYVQMTRELIPDIRGLSAISGFSHTPGAWVESIQLNKGTGSVINGYESLVGQINVEYRKPETPENLFLNFYGNIAGRFEGNASLKHKFSDKFSTSILAHGNVLKRKVDGNNDGFLDNALTEHGILMSRWKYNGNDNYVLRLDFKATDINITSGQLNFDKNNPFNPQVWGMNSDEKHQEINLKTGKSFDNKIASNIGLQVGLSRQKINRTYGLKTYLANQKSLFTNLIYSQNLLNEANILKVGTSFIIDNIVEEFKFENGEKHFGRTEKVPGIFAEYTYLPNEKITVVAGLRFDNHNLFGNEITPRLHLRYAPNDKTVTRLTAGKGWRTANIFAENLGIFASNRNIQINGNDENLPYGLQNEIAYNFGGNITQKLYYGNRNAVLSFDYYYTIFKDRVVADKESASDGTIIFKNQNEINDGQSTQVMLTSEVVDDLEIRIAYRYNLNKSYYGDEYLANVLNPYHRSFINAAYKTKSDFHFDFTLNWRGKQRIPNTNWLPTNLQLPTESDAYFLANAQIRKIFNKNFEVYLGSENLFNYTNENAIIDAENPYSENFDASIIWAPIFGRNIYVGCRIRR